MAACLGTVTSNPVRDWGLSLLLLGGIVLLVSVALGLAEFVIAQASERGYGFAGLMVPGLFTAALLLAPGGVLYAASSWHPSVVPSTTFEADVTDPDYPE